MQAKGNVMNGRLERVYAELSTVLLEHPDLKSWLAAQTRIAAREMVLRLDAYGCREADQRYRESEREAQTTNVFRIQACGTIPPPPEVQQPRIIGEIRDRELSEVDQALLLTAIYNLCVGDGLKIDPFANALRIDPITGKPTFDSLDRRAWVLFQVESYDSGRDGFGLDPDSNSSNFSKPLLLPGDEPTLLDFVLNLTKVQPVEPHAGMDRSESASMTGDTRIADGGTPVTPRRKVKRVWPSQPTDSYQHGPVEGMIQELSNWLKLSDEALYENNGKASYMICKENRTRYRCWFKEPTKYAAINAKLLAAKDSKPLKTG